MASPHLYEFQVHEDILSEEDFLFKEFNPVELDCFCFPSKNFWTTEYLMSDMPPILARLQQYVYYQVCNAGFQINPQGKMRLVECRPNSEHIHLQKSLFIQKGFPRVQVVLILTKTPGIYDSGLVVKQKLPLLHPYLKYLTVEESVRFDSHQGMGFMYQEDHSIKYVGGSGTFRMITLCFDKK